MPKRALIIASVLSALAILSIVGLTAWRNSHERDQLETALAEAKTSLEKTGALLEELKGHVATDEAKIAQLRQEKEAATRSQSNLEQEMRNALESRDVTISQLQGKLTVNILDRILFDSAEAELKPAGEAVLQKVADVLAQHPQLRIHVIGHTDNVPIRPGPHTRFASNWELSAARALAAVRFLTEKAGVDPQRLGAVAYGEFRPLADNSTAEGRARNRRIAITVLSEELAGADVVPLARTNASLPQPEPERKK